MSNDESFEQQTNREIINGADCSVIVGKTYLPDDSWAAIARVVLPDGVIGSPVRQATVNVSKAVCPETGRQMLVMTCEPGWDTAKVLLAIEWSDGCDEFTRIVKETGVFIAEIIYQGKMIRFVSNKGTIELWNEVDLSDDDLALHRNGFFTTPPEQAMRRSKEIIVS